QSFKEILREINRLTDVLAGGDAPPPALPISGTMPASSAGDFTPGFSNALTEAFEPFRTGKWFPRIVIAAAVVGLLAGAATAGFARHRPDAKEVPPPPNPLVEKQGPVMSEEETYLRQGAKRHADPSATEEKMKEGLKAQIDLAVYFLDKRRLDEADELFRELAERKYKPQTRWPEH